MKSGITTTRNGRTLLLTPPCFLTIPLQGELAGRGGRTKSYLSKLCARKGSDGGWRAEVSAFLGCRLEARINGASLPRRLLALCYSSLLTVADVMCRHDEIRSSAGLSPTAGMKD